MKTVKCISNKSNLIALGGLMSIILLSGLVLSSSITRADNDSVVDEINITVPVSCTMGGTGLTSHNAEIANGQYNSAIGESTITTFCNDNSGFAIYAIGYTGDTLGNNKLTNTTLGSTYDIETGTGLTGNSQWAMKLTPVSTPTPTYPIIIAGSTDDTAKEQGDPDFTSFQQVPDDYTKVAYRTAGTDTGTNAEGANFTTTYQAYISPTQAAGTYTGKVKYVLVHPSSAAAPILPPVPQASCNTPFPASTGITYMQQINSTNRASVLTALTQDQHYYLRDSRDEEPYCVVKLADGNLWLADNLRLDLTDGTLLANMNETNTNASNTTLGYLKGTTHGTTSDRYAITAVSDWSTNQTYGSSYSYSDPLVDIASKNSVNSSDSLSDDAKTWKYGIYYNYCAASAGSYCYGNGTNQGTSSGNASEDICPKNWRMPTGDTSGEYGILYSNSNYNTYVDYRSALRLPLSGTFLNGSASDQGSLSGFWSSSRISNNNIYNLSLDSSNVYFGSRNRVVGVPVRCVLGS